MEKPSAMRTLTVSLSQRQVGNVQRAVDSGAYASNSEVIRDALRMWEQREELRALELARLKRAYDDGLASGAPRAVEPEALLSEFKGKARTRG
jgi:antitoxin ParD1/3/4